MSPSPSPSCCCSCSPSPSSRFSSRSLSSSSSFFCTFPTLPLLPLLLVLVLVLVLLPSPSSSQRCSGLKEGVPAECRPFLSSFSFFVPPETCNLTSSDINRQATIAALTLSPIKDSCRVPALKLACGYAYQPCTTHEISPSLPNFLVFPLPRSPCGSLCTEMVYSCRGVLPESSLPDCDSMEVCSSSQQPSYPSTSSIYHLNGATYEVKCNDYPEKHDVGTTEECPKFLGLRNHGKANPPCQLPCPAPYWSNNQWWISDILLDICGPISFFSSLWVVICWLAQSRLRRFPAHLPLVPSTAAMFAGLVWCVSSIIRPLNVICEDEFTKAGVAGVCGVEGFFLEIAVMINVFYFFFICLTLFLLITLEVQLLQDQYKWYPWVIHSTGLGLPLIFAIIAWAGSAYEGYWAWCYLSGKDNFAWQVSLGYGWMAIFLFLNLLLASSVFIKLRMVQRKSGIAKKMNWRHAGMMTFVFFFWGVFGWGVAYFFYFSTSTDSFEKAVEDYILCNAQLREDCELQDRLSFWFSMSTEVIWGLSGLWCFLAFSNRRALHVNALLFLKEIFWKGNWRVILTGLSDTNIHTKGSSVTKNSSKSKEKNTHTPNTPSSA